MTLKLHNFFRSSSSTRVRAALNLKGLDYDYQAYILRKGETRTPEFLKRSPAGLVPVLELESGAHISQSMAILEWLEEEHPEPALLPSTSLEKARVRSLSYMIACEVHPLNNLRVLQKIEKDYGLDQDGVRAWFDHWVHTSFAPLEERLSHEAETGKFCHGDTPGMADICLYAQVLNNRRFEIDTSCYPTVSRIFDTLTGLDAFLKAAPSEQPDAVLNP
ncbi:MAG: maleylacetoacetate isomerase [Sneathiellales bacterium]|nr:maleylacetoacetate isomerase [Sneathiellales bacterium]